METNDNMDRGFGLELESTYGDTTVAKSSFDPDFWCQADSALLISNSETNQ